MSKGIAGESPIGVPESLSGLQPLNLELSRLFCMYTIDMLAFLFRI